jgi:hypothetical protein
MDDIPINEIQKCFEAVLSVEWEIQREIRRRASSEKIEEKCRMMAQQKAMEGNWCPIDMKRKVSEYLGFLITLETGDKARPEIH